MSEFTYTARLHDEIARRDVATVTGTVTAPSAVSAERAVRQAHSTPRESVHRVEVSPK